MQPSNEQHVATLAAAIAAAVEASEGAFLDRLKDLTGAMPYEAGNLIFYEELLFFYLALADRWLREAQADADTADEDSGEGGRVLDAVAFQAARSVALALVTPRFPGQPEDALSKLASGVADEWLGVFNRSIAEEYRQCKTAVGPSPTAALDESTCLGVLGLRIANATGHRADNIFLRASIGAAVTTVLDALDLQGKISAIVKADP
jgi:hypothetical protein